MTSIKGRSAAAKSAVEPAILAKHPLWLPPSRMHSAQGSSCPQPIGAHPEISAPLSSWIQIQHSHTSHAFETLQGMSLSVQINKHVILDPMSLPHDDKCSIWAQLPASQPQISQTPQLLPLSPFSLKPQSLHCEHQPVLQDIRATSIYLESGLPKAVLDYPSSMFLQQLGKN